MHNTGLVSLLAMAKPFPRPIQGKIFYKNSVFGFLGLKNSIITLWQGLFVYNLGDIAWHTAHRLMMLILYEG